MSIQINKTKRIVLNDEDISTVEAYNSIVDKWIPTTLKVGSGSIQTGNQVSIGDTGQSLSYKEKKEPGVFNLAPKYSFSEDGETNSLRVTQMKGSSNQKYTENDGSINYNAVLTDGVYKLTKVSTISSDNVLVWKQSFKCGTTTPTKPVKYKIYEATDDTDDTKLLLEQWLPISLWDGKVAGDEITFNVQDSCCTQTPIGGLANTSYALIYESEELFSFYGDSTNTYSAYTGHLYNIENMNVVFGNEFEYFESLSESNSTSVFQDKIDATTEVKPAGTYRIGFICETTSTSPSRDVEVRFMVNGSPIHNHTTGDDEIVVCCKNSGYWTPSDGISYLTLTTAQTIDLNIQYKDSTFGRISNAIIEIWRVK